ncbi:MAG: alpha/beta hydrolase [Candidatus Obscuribacterales bacterium]
MKLSTKTRQRQTFKKSASLLSRALLSTALLLSSVFSNYQFNSAQAAGRELITTTSHIDGGQAKAYFIPPAQPNVSGPSTLIVYHGITSSIEEPFVMPPGAPTGPILTSIYPSYGFLSVGQADTWCSPASLQDVSDTITKVQDKYKFDRIIYIGSSMGGCSLLSFIEQAPPEIKSKSESILLLVSCGDLANLYKLSSDKTLKDSLVKALGGTPAEQKNEYKARSFIANIKKFPSTVKVVIISHMEDTSMPPKLQYQLNRALASNGNPTKFIERKGAHATWPTATQFQYYVDHIIHKRLM